MSTSTRPSLIDPDFSGLWSVARLGHQRQWYSKTAGTFVMLLLLYSWIGSYILPFIIIYLMTIQYYTTAIILTSIAISPYIFNIPPQPSICRLYMKWGSSYFKGGTSMIFEKEPAKHNDLPPISNPIHAHGVFCLGYLFCVGVRFRAMQGVTDKNTLTEFLGKIWQIEHLKGRNPMIGFAINYLIKAPLFSLFFTTITGCLIDSSAKNMKAHMKQQKSFAILPGGFNEASAFDHGVNVIYIKSRKGFIKYCLQYGYEIWPCYIFGECDTFWNLLASSSDTALVKWLSDNKVPTVIPAGPYWWNPLLPSSKTGLHAIYSGNTRYEKIENPTQAQIDECHAWYMKEIHALFERHKWRFGYADDVKMKIL